MKRYIAIDLLALKQNNLSLEEWTLLENIYFMSNNELGYCYASKETLRDVIQVSNGQIYKIITRLIETGFLVKNKQTGFIKVTQKWIVISSGDTLQKMENESPKNGKDTLQKMEIKKDNIKRDIKEEKINKKDLDLVEIENELSEKFLGSTIEMKYPLADKYQDFIQHRKEIKKPITELAAKQHIQLLCKYPRDIQVEIINQSISSGWSGLFEPKKQFAQPMNKRENFNNLVNEVFADLEQQRETVFDVEIVE